MQIGFIGLGRIGGHSVIGDDPSPAARQTATAAGARGADSIKASSKRSRRRALWG